MCGRVRGATLGGPWAWRLLLRDGGLAPRPLPLEGSSSWSSRRWQTQVPREGTLAQGPQQDGPDKLDAPTHHIRELLRPGSSSGVLRPPPVGMWAGPLAHTALAVPLFLQDPLLRSGPTAWQLAPQRAVSSLASPGSCHSHTPKCLTLQLSKHAEGEVVLGRVSRCLGPAGRG